MDMNVNEVEEVQPLAVGRECLQLSGDNIGIAMSDFQTNAAEICLAALEKYRGLDAEFAHTLDLCADAVLSNWRRTATA